MQIIKFYERGWDNNQILIQWNLGNTCNYSCEYCPTYLHSGDRPWPDINAVTKFLLMVRDKFPDKNINVEFLGGEVTLWNELISLLKFCKENNFSSLILSNASRTTRYWKELSFYLDKVLLTYHGHTCSKTHYEKILDICLSNNVETISHLTLVQDRFDEMLQYKLYLKEKYQHLNVDLVLMMDKMKNKSYNGYFYNYTSKEIGLVSTSPNSTDSAFIAELDDGTERVYSLNQIKQQNLNSFRGFICDPEMSVINIDFNGNASTSLCGSKTRINIFQDPIEKLFSQSVCQLEECKNPADIRTLKINGNVA